MLFAVVIPTYNRLPLLKEALESLWRQTFTDYEVIVVDDGSTDGTADFVRSLGAPELEAQAKQRSQTQKNIDVLFVGRLFKGKGIFVLADALARIGAGGKTLRACFVGVGPDERILRDALAKTPNVQSEFMGGLAVERLSEVYPRARCLAVPSTTHPEGMPLVIGEALTFGVPVVGSDQPAIVEAVGDGGRICPQGDSAALAHALESLLVDEAARTQLSQRALRSSERFSSLRFAAAAQRLVAEMVSNAP